jgi:hypothetical protein
MAIVAALCGKLDPPALTSDGLSIAVGEFRCNIRAGRFKEIY